MSKLSKSVLLATALVSTTICLSVTASSNLMQGKQVLAQAANPVAKSVAGAQAATQNKQIAAKAAEPEVANIKCQYLCMNLNGNGTKVEMTPSDLVLKNPAKFGFQCQFNPNDLSSTCDKFLEPFIQDGIKQIKEVCKTKKKSEVDLIIPVMMVCF